MKEAVKVEGLWFRYDELSDWVLKDVSLKIFQGEFVAILGRNGCGKTTLVKHFNGLLKPCRGEVSVFGVNTRNLSTAELTRRVGYVFQYPDSQIFAETVFEEVCVGPKNLGFPKEGMRGLVNSTLKKVRLKLDLEASPFSLSTGEKERLAIADVLAMNPRVLILDEPTTGQDYSTCRRIMEVARDYADNGNTVVLISHDIDLVCEWVDRVILMKDGRILVEGVPDKVFMEDKALREAGIEAPSVLGLAKAAGIDGKIIRMEDLVEELIRRIAV